LKRNEQVRNLFDSMRGHHPNLMFGDISDSFCNRDTKRCATTNKKGFPLYNDDDHLSNSGSKILVDLFSEWQNRF